MIEPSEAELAQFEGATTDTAGIIETPPKLEAADRKIRKNLGKAEVAQAKLANKQRDHFFKFVVAAVAFSLASSVGLMALYFWSEWHEIDSAVLIAWFSANVVQVIGLAYVIANYLFPSSAKSDTPPSEE